MASDDQFVSSVFHINLVVLNNGMWLVVAQNIMAISRSKQYHVSL